MFDFYFYMEMSYQVECLFFVVVMTFQRNTQTNRKYSIAKGDGI